MPTFALTSHLMKTLKRLVLAHLHPLVRPSMDLLQFAYQPHIRVDEAIIYLLHRSLSRKNRKHLERTGSIVRMSCFFISQETLTLYNSSRLVNIQEMNIETVQTYKYLGVTQQQAGLHRQHQCSVQEKDRVDCTC